MDMEEESGENGRDEGRKWALLEQEVKGGVFWLLV